MNNHNNHIKLIIVCHFCEIHGPSVISCSHVLETSPYKSSSNSSNSSIYSKHENNNLMSFDEQDFSYDPMFLSSDHECDGCTMKSKHSGQYFRGFVSFDAPNNSHYVTAQFPMLKDGITKMGIIKDACVRSLSCEIYQGNREGVIYFGDDKRGHVLSYLFALPDSQARGFNRTYSILILEESKPQLMSNWDFYVQVLEQVIKQLKDKSKSVFDNELTQTTSQQRRSLMLDNLSQMGVNAASLDGTLFGRHSLNTQRTNSKSRSIIELTRDENIFANLHLQFSFLLTAIKNRYEDVANFDINDWTSQLPVQELNTSLSFRQLYKYIGKDKFNLFAYHTIVGNQIIICDTQKQRLSSIIQCLSSLLPDKCIKAKVYSQNYDSSWNFNLLGISHVSLLPECLLNSDNYLVANVISNETNDNAIKLNIVSNKINLPEKLPNFLTDLEKVLIDMSFSDSTLNSYFISLRQEWMNKAQVIYAFCMRKGIERNEDNMRSILKMMLVEECDLKLINFWLDNGLTYEFKSKFATSQNGSINGED